MESFPDGTSTFSPFSASSPSLLPMSFKPFYPSKAAFLDSNTKVFDSWESSTPVCSFSGITCDSNGFVKEIELSNRNLTGLLPLSSICQLKSLEKLSLGFNNLYGRVTQDLNACVSLTYLDLGNNVFSGSFPEVSSLSGIEGEIPEEIGNLGELIELELSQNYITGEIPRGITKLKKLWQLELYLNDLTGELPPGLGNLTNLEYFDASTNRLYGNLSEIRTAPQKLGSWAEFIFIDVSENFLSGPIPPDMCKKGTMWKLLMLQNNFTGEIPGSYANCTTLIRFSGELTFFSIICLHPIFGGILTSAHLPFSRAEVPASNLGSDSKGTLPAAQPRVVAGFAFSAGNTVSINFTYYTFFYKFLGQPS
ncbi:Receptor-like protein kinase [Sesamum angolense]|uniref:Receptor-like protein kinase n=1 Tax=Sesamum angolense TaxID=2727404 RepID=A0AAE1WZQ9_9LAMI|nr:Receptor-like protein kinase [Sesamum angolense]